MRPLAALVCALALLLSGCGSDSGTASQPSAATGVSGDGASAPEVLDFRAETVSGEPFDGASLVGKPTVFWFWAPWCPTCRAQVAGVGELAAAYGADVNVVGIGALDEPKAIEWFADEVSPEVTLLSDPRGAVWRHLGVTAQSTYLVLDENGVELASGYLDDAELVAVVDDLVG